ncbi:MAG TPA: phosphatidylserine decarboxylase family protein [Terracidiphilus sp.]|nr:phosphatidylserine decarboxylase family protein [Terracidiphilus sp.]
MVRDGYIYGVSLLAVALVAGWATGRWEWGIVPVLLAIFFLWFFRDPERAIPSAPGLIVSPADGLVTEAVSISTPGGPRQRVSIFLSVFDVHVNRAPIAGVVESADYHKGKFVNAMNPACAESNERNIVTMRGEGIEITFKQIAGLLARRIVFPLKQGDRVERGERVGMIKFGSRTDIVMPADAEIQVKVGERVKGGASIIAIMAAGAMAGESPQKRRAAQASADPDDEGDRR